MYPLGNSTADRLGRETSSPRRFDGLAGDLEDDVDWVVRTCAHLSLSGEYAAEVKRRAALVRDRLASPHLHLAVVGEFNSGKSTFINTLLRDRLLPTAPVVTTGTATEIRHGDTLSVSFRARGAGGSVAYPGEGQGGGDAFLRTLRAIEPGVAMPATARDAIRTLIADPRVCGGVDTVTITHPAVLLGEDVVLVDTPGINATDDLHAEVVDRVLAETADLAVVLVPAHSPVSRVLSDFLAGPLSRHLDRCVFVVTKFDDIEPTDRAPLLRSVHKRLQLAGVGASAVFAGGGNSVLAKLIAGGNPDRATADFLELESALAGLALREHVTAVSTSATYLVEDMLAAATKSVAEHRGRIADAQRELDQLRVRDLDGLIAEIVSGTRSALVDERRAVCQEIDEEATEVARVLADELDTRLDACATTVEIGTLVRETGPELLRDCLAAWCEEAHGRTTRLAAVTDRALERAGTDFAAEYRRLARLAGQASAALAVPTVPVTGGTVAVHVDFGSAASAVATSIGTRNVATGGAAAVGMVLGTILFPGLGTAIGGALGAWFGSKMGDQVGKARDQVRQPLRDGCRAAVEQASDALRTAVHTACDAEETRCAGALDGLRRVATEPVNALLAEERRSRAALDAARDLAAAAEREADQRLARLAARRAELRARAS